MNATEVASFFTVRRLEEATDDVGLITNNNSSIIRETLRLYGSLYICCFIAYCVLRRRCPRLFNVRSWVPELECEIAHTEYGTFDWFWKVFEVTDEDLFRHCGMDAMCKSLNQQPNRRIPNLPSTHSRSLSSLTLQAFYERLEWVVNSPCVDASTLSG
jgi:hypothetical protein